MNGSTDQYWMQAALAQAERAAAHGEVPVGAVIVRDNRIIAAAHNRKEAGDPTAHAELLAIREAATVIGDWRLLDAALYVTLEPCLMCVGALIQARVPRLVYGAADPKFGAVESMIKGLDYPWNHRPEVRGGVEAEAAASQLKRFFAARRKTNNDIEIMQSRLKPDSVAGKRP